MADHSIKLVKAERRDVVSVIKKLGEQRAGDLRLVGNTGGAMAIKAMTRDLVAQVQARYRGTDEGWIK